jgi:hypothetical protein
MLDMTFLSDDILEVKETTFTFMQTKVSYFYYDIVNWIRYNYRPVSTPMTVELIKSNPTPDKKHHDECNMSESDIQWCKTYYIPKAKSPDK